MITRAFVIAILIVLTLAASAGAECAWAKCPWILWEENVVTAKGARPSRDYRTVDGYATQSDCLEGVAFVVQEKFTVYLRSGIKTETTADSISFTTGSITLSHMYTCLPDTVDPRGPKGAQ